MNVAGLIDLWSDALMTAASIAAPFLATSLAVGLLVSLIQAATQMQENILAFVPKLIVVGMVLSLAGGWLMDRVSSYTKKSFSSIVELSSVEDEQ